MSGIQHIYLINLVYLSSKKKNQIIKKGLGAEAGWPGA